MNELEYHKKYSRFYNVDSDGYIINESSLSKINEIFLPTINYIKTDYLSPYKEHVYSVYLRGSVPRGMAKDIQRQTKHRSHNLSDVDVIIISKHEESKSILEEHVSKINNPYEILIDTKVVDINEIFSQENYMLGFQHRFILKILAVNLLGVDVYERLEQFKPRSNILFGYKYLYQIFNLAIQEIKDLNIKDHTNLCNWLAKHILKAGLAICIDRENKYTPDLYLCFEVFSKWYPQYKSEIKNIFELCLYPINDKGVISDMITNMQWMITECNRRISQ